MLSLFILCLLRACFTWMEKIFGFGGKPMSIYGDDPHSSEKYLGYFCLGFFRNELPNYLDCHISPQITLIVI